MSINKSLKAQVWLLYSVIFIAIIGAGVILLTGWTQNKLISTKTTGSVEDSVEVSHIIASHVGWVTELNNSLLNKTSFNGSLDSANCSLGLWEQSLSEEIKK
jgi:hypothetical protein